MEVDALFTKVRQYAVQGTEYLNSQNEIDLINMIALCNNYYFNKGISLVTDELYDVLTEYSKNKYPKKKKQTSVGAKVAGKNKVKLPFMMASMNKIKPEMDALIKWKETYRGPYVITCKLDGVSALYDGRHHKLYTRGDGIEGQDISHLLPHLGMDNLDTDCVFRGELIIKKKLFKEKYGDVYANPRNMVAGLVNKKANTANANDNVLKEMLGDVNFVVYELVEPSFAPSVQYEVISKFPEIKQVYNMELEIITNDILTTILLEIRELYDYETDGIIITNDEAYDRYEELKNPDHAFAFKMALKEQSSEATVTDVIWTPSKDGYMKPRVQISPVQLCGVKIEYATGFNANYIYENKIGVGTVIEIIRSGDVIPYINKIIKPSEAPKMPQPMSNYVWNDTNTDLILKEELKSENIDVLEKQIARFFKKLKVEGLSNGNVRKILNYDGNASIESICNMTKEDFKKIPGFPEKVKDNIKDRLQKDSLPNMMAASNVFGRGFSDKRMKDIIEAKPDILISTYSREEKIQMVTNVNGISIKMATQFVENIEQFITFMKKINMAAKLLTTVKKAENETEVLIGKSYAFTGFRDEELQEFITQNGGKFVATLTKNTTGLIVKDTDYKANTKTTQAENKNIPIITREQFYETYK
jgi:DNA ligase (NAD+)|uniref:DNA ligase (NAD(+)) n=1 Tax=viral metagenome TaxID=1070528 RepID=A0A6C0IMV1_9ZZZZ